MTEELAEYLIDLDKYIVQNGEKVDNYTLNIQYPMNLRIILTAPDDLDQSLLVDIKESEKKALKISLHHQDDSTKNGILRIDYNGRHKNPEEILPSVPEVFVPFAGKYLDEYAGHIHYVINGYKPLAWALPLEFDDFPVKKIEEKKDYSQILEAFFNKINLKTLITYNHQLSLL